MNHGAASDESFEELDGGGARCHADLMCSGREIWHSAAPECQSKFADGMISLDERTDTTSLAGELVIHVFGAIAQFERRLISERTKDWLATARKHGRNPGRPPLPQK